MESNGFTTDPLFTVQANDILSGPTCDYQIEDFLGQGTFGKVARCRIPTTKETAAVKIIRRDRFRNGEKEARIMEKVRKLDPDKNNFLKLTEHFTHNNHFCLVYELLDVSLFDFMDSRSKPLQLSEIRVVALQMLVALKALKSIHLVHGDIKPDNIMLVNHKDQPFKVKLIDFGIATEVSNLRKKGVVQNLAYRSPEALLHHPTLDEGVDMWSLGCVLAFLFLRDDLYPYECEYEAMRMIIQLNGQPDNDFLNEALNTDSFFDLVQGKPEQMWWLKPPEQYTLKTGEEILEHRRTSCNFYSLNNLMMRQPERKIPIVYEDTKSFISLLSQMLEVNPKERITPAQALCHSFFTFRHFPVDEESPYLIQAKEMMNVCHSEEENTFSNQHEEENSRTIGRYGSSVSDTVKNLPIGKGTSDAGSEQNKIPSEQIPVTKDNLDTPINLAVRKGTHGGTSKHEQITSGPEPVVEVKPDTSTGLVVRKRTRDTSSEQEKVTSGLRTVTEVKQDTSINQVSRNKTNEVTSCEDETPSVTRDHEDSSRPLAHKTSTPNARSKTDKVQVTSNELPQIISDEKEIISDSTFVTEDPADPSSNLVSRNRSWQVISSEEPSQLTVLEEQLEEHSVQPCMKGSTNEVKHSKKHFRGIRKFFSRLFKHLSIRLSERKINKDNQFD